MAQSKKSAGSKKTKKPASTSAGKPAKKPAKKAAPAKAAPAKKAPPKAPSKTGAPVAFADEAQTLEARRAYARLVAKYWADPAFRKELEASPATVLPMYGVTVPKGMTVRVVEVRADEALVPIPEAGVVLETDALSAMDHCFGTAGTLGTAGSIDGTLGTAATFGTAACWNPCFPPEEPEPPEDPEPEDPKEPEDDEGGDDDDGGEGTGGDDGGRIR